MSATFTIGKSNNTGLPVHVRDAENGLKSNCVCYDCNGQLEAVQGSRDWHFRHSNKTNCTGSKETALHEFAKQVLCDNNSINTTKKRIAYSNPKKESVTGSFRSDVSAIYTDKEIHFEIVVNHDLQPTKRDHYKDNKINCIKVNLSDPSLLKATPEQIIKAVLEDKWNKCFIHWNEDSNQVETKASTINFTKAIGGVLLFLGSIVLLKRIFSKGKKKGYKRW